MQGLLDMRVVQWLLVTVAGVALYRVARVPRHWSYRRLLPLFLAVGSASWIWLTPATDRGWKDAAALAGIWAASAGLYLLLRSRVSRLEQLGAETRAIHSQVWRSSSVAEDLRAAELLPYPGGPVHAVRVNAYRIPGVDRAWVEQVLGELRSLERMISLELKGVPLRDEDLAVLSGHTMLLRLDLTGAEITDAGIEHLWPLEGLEQLILNSTQVGDAAMSRLPRLPSLEHLEISLTQVTDKGVRHLKRLRKLRILLLGSMPGASAAAVRELEEALPELSVF